MPKNTPVSTQLVRSRLIFKSILNTWSVLTIVLFTLDFFSQGAYSGPSGIVGIVYLAILGMYVGEKEYNRWQRRHTSRFIGEGFIVIWTLLMVFLTIISAVSGGTYRISPDYAVIYTSIVGVFAVSQGSKALRTKR